MGYMNLFIAYNDNDISMNDITVSFLRESYPRNLMGYLKNDEFSISEYDKGIYHVRKQGHVDMQIGTCTVYVYARNGYAKKVSVTVK